MTGQRLGDLALVRRVGATVILDGERLAVWSYSARGPVWLWRPDDASLVEVPEAIARELPLVAAHSIYRPGVRDCTKRDEHVWPGDLAPDSQCERCALAYRDFSLPAQRLGA